ARAQSMMLINKQDLGLLPSAVDDGDFSVATIFFPNPITESLTIRFATPYSGSISISDISGRAVMVRDVTDLSEEVNIDMSYLASGIYIVRLPQHISGRSFKVVKM
ncbi:MAG TPA: T9SS type A sorting domain-containing protein, partial [Saprospiraceae bacterium]|nr:T9SS type A sorting domain-containing protein [Saprospiraceae bacterium]